MPHGLIAAFGGDTVAAAQAWADRFADEMNVTVLVDFENDSVRTALEVADALGDRLWGVRLDTSELMVDRALWHEMGDFKPTGVNPELVEKVREALDAAGHERRAHRGLRRVRRRRRSGEFESVGAPVDAYGVGSSLVQGANDFTADVVRVDGGATAPRPARRFSAEPRLERVVVGLMLSAADGRLG